MKKGLALFIAVMAFALVQSVGVWAAEHGGQEHGGSTTATHEGSHGHNMSDKDVLLEAAAALQSTDPGLAAKLTEMAGGAPAQTQEHGGKEHGGS